MKKIILLCLFSLNVQAQQINCGTTSVEELAACTIEDKLLFLLHRMKPKIRIVNEVDYYAEDPCILEELEEGQECPPWDPKKNTYYLEEQEYDENGNPELTTHTRLVMKSRPSKNKFRAELAVWVAEETAKIEWRAKVDAIPDMRYAMSLCNFKNRNVSKFKANLYKKIDDERVTCLESKVAQILEEIEEYKEQREIEKKSNYCMKMYRKLYFRANKSGKSKVKRKRVRSKLADFKEACEVGELEDAVTEIEALKNDSDIPEKFRNKIKNKVDKRAKKGE